LLELNPQQKTEDEAYYLTLGDGIIHREYRDRGNGQMLHGAGIWLPTKLGNSWGKCRDSYSSTMVRIWD